MAGRVALGEVVDVSEIVEPGKDFLAYVGVGLLPAWEVVDDEAHLFESEEVVVAEAGSMTIRVPRPKREIISDNFPKEPCILFATTKQLFFQSFHHLLLLLSFLRRLMTLRCSFNSGT